MFYMNMDYFITRNNTFFKKHGEMKKIQCRLKKVMCDPNMVNIYAKKTYWKEVY